MTYPSTGPLTWAQRYRWLVTDWAGRPPFLLRDVWFVPASRRVADVRVALRALAGTHEVLRTAFKRDGGAEPGQTVVPLRLFEVPVAVLDVADGPLRLDDLSVPAEVHPDYQWRAVLLVQDGRPKAVVIQAEHLVTDGWALDLLRKQFHALLRGRRPETVPMQPLDRVRSEAGPEGRALTEEARRYFAGLLARAPHVTLPARYDVADPARRYVRVSRTVPRLRSMVDVVAKRCRSAPSAVILAAWCLLLCRHADQPACLIRSICSNRTDEAEQDAVFVLYQPAYLVVDVSEAADFTELVRQVAVAALAAYRHGAYEPTAMLEAIGAEVARSGRYARFQFDFDYVSTSPLGLGTHGTPDFVDEATGVQIRWEPDGRPYYSLLEVYTSDTALETVFGVDTAVVPADLAIEMLVGFEELMHRLAESVDPLPIAAVGTGPRAGGIRVDGGSSPVASPMADIGWQRSADSWVNVAELRSLVASAPHVRDAEVHLLPGENGSEAWVAVVSAAGDGLDLDLVDAHVVRALPRSCGAVRPARYLLAEGAIAASGGGFRDVMNDMLGARLVAIVREALGSSSPDATPLDLSRSYLALGGRLSALPVLVERLTLAAGRRPDVGDFELPVPIGLVVHGLMARASEWRSGDR